MDVPDEQCSGWSCSRDVAHTWVSLILFRVPVRLSLRVSRLDELSVWWHNNRASVHTANYIKNGKYPKPYRLPALWNNWSAWRSDATVLSIYCLTKILWTHPGDKVSFSLWDARTNKANLLAHLCYNAAERFVFAYSPRQRPFSWRTAVIHGNRMHV